MHHAGNAVLVGLVLGSGSRARDVSRPGRARRGATWRRPGELLAADPVAAESLLEKIIDTYLDRAGVAGADSGDAMVQKACRLSAEDRDVLAGALWDEAPWE